MAVKFPVPPPSSITFGTEDDGVYFEYDLSVSDLEEMRVSEPLVVALAGKGNLFQFGDGIYASAAVIGRLFVKTQEEVEKDVRKLLKSRADLEGCFIFDAEPAVLMNVEGVKALTDGKRYRREHDRGRELAYVMSWIRLGEEGLLPVEYSDAVIALSCVCDTADYEGELASKYQLLFEVAVRLACDCASVLGKEGKARLKVVTEAERGSVDTVEPPSMRTLERDLDRLNAVVSMAHGEDGE